MRNINQLNLQKPRLLIALLWLLFGIACTSEEDTGGYIDEGRSVYLSINALNTKSAPVEPDETINTIRVIIAKRNDEGTIITNKFGITNPLGIDTKSGLYDVYVITNESETVGGELLELNAITNIAELKKKQAAFDLTKRVKTNLPMFGIVRDVHMSAPVSGVSSFSNPGSVQVNGQNYGSTLPVNVDRLAIKVSLTLMSKSFKELESVVLTNIPDSVSLLGNAYENNDNSKLQKVDISDLVERTPLSGFIWEKGTKEEIYLPSNMLADPTSESNAIKLEVKEVGGEKKIISLGHLVEENYNTKDYTLHPNTIYTFIGRISGSKLIINASIADWGKKNQNFPTGGGKWLTQPIGMRIGINPENGGKATFNVEFGSNAPKYYQWYQKYQKYNAATNKIETVIKALSETDTDTLTIDVSTEGILNITTKKIDVSGEIYCVASTISPDGSVERSESDHVTLMAVGENYQWPEKSFPSMQDFKAPLNAPLGSTCILQDERDGNIYHVKLMADGNWWMIQDLAYGNTVSELDYINNWFNTTKINLIESGLYGVAISSGLSTGGYLYNTFATIQLGGATYAELEVEVALEKKYEYLQGLCPKGWHYPGNVDRKYNKEWTDLQQMAKINLNSFHDFSLFDYNDPYSFNAYTQSGAFGNSLLFAGGCVVVQDGMDADPEFRSQSIRAHENSRYSGISITNHIGVSSRGDTKIPTRCLRNFK